MSDQVLYKLSSKTLRLLAQATLFAMVTKSSLEDHLLNSDFFIDKDGKIAATDLSFEKLQKFVQQLAEKGEEIYREQQGKVAESPSEKDEFSLDELN